LICSPSASSYRSGDPGRTTGTSSPNAAAKRKVHRPAAGDAAGRVPELPLGAAHTRDMSGNSGATTGTDALIFGGESGPARHVRVSTMQRQILSKSCAR
jgi:hypothetical protein